MRLQWKALLMIGTVTLLGIVLINVTLVASLAGKDRREAEALALATGELIRDSILSVMIATGDYDLVSAVIDEIKDERFARFRMIRNEHLHKQFGVRTEKLATAHDEKKALATGQTVTTTVDDDTVRIVLPFVTDGRCGKCHRGMDGIPVPAGIVNGAAVITFNFATLVAESHRVTYAIVAQATGAMALFGAILLLFTHAVITKPMKRLATAVTQLRREEFDVNLPPVGTKEFDLVAEELREAARTLAGRRAESEAELARQRAINDDVMGIIRSRAAALGVTDTDDVDSLMRGFSVVADEAERERLSRMAREYQIAGMGRFVIPSDPALIPAVAVLVSEQFAAASSGLSARSVELALDEALSNALYHGNLEVESALKENDFDLFLRVAQQRLQQDPYRGRRVTIDVQFDRDSGVVAITDEGGGFDWGGWMKGIEADEELASGRGILIMRTLAREIHFNQKGNRVEMIFDMTRPREGNGEA